MKMSQVLAIPHKIIDSVTPESFAKDTGACLVIGARLIKDLTKESGFAETEKLMPITALIPKQKKRKMTESSVKFDTAGERKIIDSDSERAKRIERYRAMAEQGPIEDRFEENERELIKKQIAFCNLALKAGWMQDEEFEDDE
jgi:phage anti-repressor protein